jgi:chorismatase
MLFVSGTASITGHQTQYANDPAAQCELTLDNIQHLISRENLSAQGHDVGFDLDELSVVKVYIRNASDMPMISSLVARRLPRSQILYLNANICRSDLDVEIEGVISRQP